jgi:hypothetical protein
MSLLHAISVFLEFICFVLGLKMVFEKKRYIGVAWAITFGIFIFYDLNRSLVWGLPREFMDTVLLIAALSALLAMWHLSSKRS